VADPQPNYELVRERLKRARRRRNLSLREVADEIEVSASTLSRIERGAGTPDLPTLNKLIAWLEIRPEAVYQTNRRSSKSLPQEVEVLLRADKELDPKTAKTLARIFRTAYKEMTST
jgi:transcriptional regulator with XRE-family HTH domain